MNAKKTILVVDDGVNLAKSLASRHEAPKQVPERVPMTRAERRRLGKRRIKGEVTGLVACKFCLSVSGTLVGTKFRCNTTGCKGQTI